MIQHKTVDGSFVAVVLRAKGAKRMGRPMPAIIPVRVMLDSTSSSSAVNLRTVFGLMAGADARAADRAVRARGVAGTNAATDASDTRKKICCLIEYSGRTGKNFMIL